MLKELDKLINQRIYLFTTTSKNGSVMILKEYDNLGIVVTGVDNSTLIYPWTSIEHIQPYF